jgi:penicillin-binding protein 1A
VVDMMKDVIRKGTAYGSVWGAGFQLPAAGKTGTTNDGADVWFIGYTADVVAGVWMGFDKPTKIKANAQGGQLAAPAWTAFMREVYGRKPAPPDWPRPSSLISMRVDAATGLRWGPQCPAEDGYLEWFLPGTEPQGDCPPRREPIKRP